jgi:hypothetical protein
MPAEYRIEGVKVVSFSGEDRGTFDATHIVGSEVIRGVGTEVAIDRGFRARDIVELASAGMVSTDSIRYVLDGLREVKPGEYLKEDDLRLFKEHVRNAARGPAAKAVRQESGAGRREVDLGSNPKAPPREGGVVLVGPPPDMTTRTRTTCVFQVVSRQTTHQPFIRVSPLQFAHSSEGFTTQQVDRIVEELKTVLEEKLSNEITFNEFGASASLTGTALEQFLREYVRTHTFVIFHYTVIVTGTITMSVHSTVQETWAWEGSGCPPNVEPPEILTYTLVGPEVTYEFAQTFEAWEKKAQESMLGGEDWAASQARKHVVGLINRGAWIDQFPVSPNLPSPSDFS